MNESDKELARNLINRWDSAWEVWQHQVNNPTLTVNLGTITARQLFNDLANAIGLLEQILEDD